MRSRRIQLRWSAVTATRLPCCDLWPGKAPQKQAADELAKLAMRRLTDAAASRRPLMALKARASDYTWRH